MDAGLAAKVEQTNSDKSRITKEILITNFIIIKPMSILNDKKLINDFAESIGIKNLDKDALNLLVQEIEIRVREIIQEAKKIMRHSKRSMLKSEDVTLAMRKLNIERIFGYATSIPYVYEKIDPSSNLWALKPQQINLKDYFTKPFLKTPIESFYSFHWLALDGKQPRIAENITVEEEANDEAMHIDEPPIVESSKISREFVNERIKEDHIMKEHEHFFENFRQLYIEEVTRFRDVIKMKQFISKEFSKILLQIKNEPNMKPIFNLILDLILNKHEEKKEVNVDLLNIMTITAFMLNKYVNLEPQLHHVISLLMEVLLSNRTVTYSFTFAVMIKSNASTALNILVKRSFAIKYPNLISVIVNYILKYLIIEPKSAAAFYGAIHALATLGSSVFKFSIRAEFQKIFDNVEKLYQKETNEGTLGYAAAAYDCLLESSVKYLTFLRDYEKDYGGAITFYDELREKFGAKLDIYIPRLKGSSNIEYDPLNSII